MSSQVDFGTRQGAVLPLPEPFDSTDERLALVRRVLGSRTFEHCPKLRAFFEYVCHCAIENDPSAATEPQIGIHVFGRPPGYNTNEDNIVRSQARLLRLKLEHHFANEGVEEPIVVIIPKGRYLPVFEPRSGNYPLEGLVGQEIGADKDRPAQTSTVSRVLGRDLPSSKKLGGEWPFWVFTLCVVAALTWVAAGYYRGRLSSIARTPNDDVVVSKAPPVLGNPQGSVSIAAGYQGPPYTDVSGKRWAADEFFDGGVAGDGPQELWPPISDPSPFKRIREGVSLSAHRPTGFQYNIPAGPGTYELRLYFADPKRHALPGHDGQHLRHFQVNLNGAPILNDFDPVADAGYGAIDVRAFKGVSPAADGKVHVEFVPAGDRPFVSALELSPGTPGRMQPIRFTAHIGDLVDADGTHWSGDEYFIDGNTLSSSAPEDSARIPPLYTAERFGNFSYAIPVPPGSYTVKLHFMETFFGPSAPAGLCWGAGCRIFDVSCNGQMLLKDFDIFKTAGGDYQAVVKTFKGIHPNGQGKLLIAFSPSVDYAEVRAIEVLDEGAPATGK